LKIKFDDKITMEIILILIGLFSFIFWGFTGFKIIFGILLVFFLPSYLILDNFNISRSEKIIFSFFIGIGVFSSIAYWLGVFISFKLAIAITFVFLVLVGVLIKKFKH